MSAADKRALYDAGRYLTPVPPVCHIGWSDQNWIDFIDSHGKWLKAQ